MPRFYNIDHSPVSVENGPAVASGDTYDFTDEQVAAGIAGLWSENDPRGPALRDESPVTPVASLGNKQPIEPAPPENQENS